MFLSVANFLANGEATILPLELTTGCAAGAALGAGFDSLTETGAASFLVSAGAGAGVWLFRLSANAVISVPFSPIIAKTASTSAEFPSSTPINNKVPL